MRSRVLLTGAGIPPKVRSNQIRARATLLRSPAETVPRDADLGLLTGYQELLVIVAALYVTAGLAASKVRVLADRDLTNDAEVSLPSQAAQLS